MSQAFDKLIDIMAILRGPDGCPWDHEQTHLTILSQLIEEAYEFIDSAEAGNDAHMAEELGDLLLHVIFHAQMAADRKAFDIHTVITTLSDKLVRRHPHVFADESVKDAGEVMVNWDAIKATEKKAHKNESILDSVPKGLPALAQAFKLSKKAAKTGFDWEKTDDVIKKIEEEIAEVTEAYESKGKEELESEIGDLFFALTNFCRFLKIEPEEALRKTNNRFRSRFGHMEKQAKKKDLKTFKAGDWEKMWDNAKKELK